MSFVETGAVMVSVDIRTELAAYPWINARWTEDKLIAASPFRYDKTPSFFVNLNADSQYYGCWTDSGAISDDWRSGSFTKLLSFLRNETYSETVYYLSGTYGNGPEDVDGEPTLRPNIIREDRPQPVRSIDSAILDGYRYHSDYLSGRGITEAAQQMCGVGYDPRRKAVTIPWMNAAGSLANVKYRRIDSKIFWFVKNGRPIRECIFGIDIVYRRSVKRAVIVEAEIDAMTLMSAGCAAVATGGTAFTESKRDLIVRSPLEEIVILRDNDSAGRAWQRRLIAELGPYIGVRIAVVPSGYKDANEFAVKCGLDKLRACVLRSRRVSALKRVII